MLVLQTASVAAGLGRAGNAVVGYPEPDDVSGLGRLDPAVQRGAMPENVRRRLAKNGRQNSIDILAQRTMADLDMSIDAGRGQQRRYRASLLRE
jgi:hypothetical protein